MFRLAQAGTVVGFFLVVVSIWLPEFGSVTVMYGLALLLTGAFAWWGLRKHRSQP